jgi:DNA polymerase-3 subunit delta
MVKSAISSSFHTLQKKSLKTMSVEKIIGNWKKKSFRPVYLLEGEEDYYIDKLVNFAEHQILSESESPFNLSVFYGKDTDWSTLINACRRYPVFAERQVVILKEAQQMRDIDKLEPYVAKPLESTILIIAYKEKKLDGRTKLAKILRDKAEILSTKKIYDNQIPQWIMELTSSKGIGISPKATALLADHIGNDLSRIENEVDKMLINLGSRKEITEDDIEVFVGVSKEYNVFELQDAVARKNLSKAMRIIQYFQSNPKAAPIQLILPSLYNFFGKTYMIFGQQGADEKTLAATLGVSPFFMKGYMSAAHLYSFEGVEAAILLLHEYNLRSIGVNSSGQEDASLLKELVVKMLR